MNKLRRINFNKSKINKFFIKTKNTKYMLFFVLNPSMAIYSILEKYFSNNVIFENVYIKESRFQKILSLKFYLNSENYYLTKKNIFFLFKSENYNFFFAGVCINVKQLLLPIFFENNFLYNFDKLLYLNEFTYSIYLCFLFNFMHLFRLYFYLNNFFYIYLNCIFFNVYNTSGKF